MATSHATPTQSASLIAVIGGTGAQGQAVVAHLVRDGAYRVRALTRDPSHSRAKALLELGPEGSVELVQGNAMCEASVTSLFDGADGAFVNLDGFVMGERREVFWGIRIFEIAMGNPTLNHYVWGSLDYTLQAAKWDAGFRTGHYDAKGRVARFMRSFASPIPENHMTWSALTSGPYLEMLREFLAPRIDPDGTRVFAAPLGSGRVAFVALDDLGWYARYMFDHPKEFEGVDLRVLTEKVGAQHLVDTFTKVTGLKARFVDVPEDEFLSTFPEEKPAGYNDKLVQLGEDPPMTFRENFRGFWRMWRYDLLTRDEALLDRIHPQRMDLETWMRTTGYDGTRADVLKLVEEGKGEKGYGASSA